MNHDQRDEGNLDRRRELQQDEEAFQLHQEEKRLETARRSNTFMWIVNSIYWLSGMLGILLVLRFALRLSGANPSNEVAQVINNLSEPFVAPFSTLFVSATAGRGGSVFDVNILIAIAVYAILSYLAVSLVRFIFYQRV